MFQSADEFDVPLKDKVKTFPGDGRGSNSYFTHSAITADARLGCRHVQERRRPHETLRTIEDNGLDGRSETVGRASNGQ